MFKEVARVLKDTIGELKCEIDNENDENDENDDPRFEFFTIKQGELLVQRARIVRDAEIFTV